MCADHWISRPFSFCHWIKGRGKVCYGRVMKFMVIIDDERCKGCELCVAACPQDVLRMSERLNAKGYAVAENVAPDRCTGCKQCSTACPDVAITIERAAGRETAASAAESAGGEPESCRIRSG